VGQDGSFAIGNSTDSSRFQSRALFAGLEQGEGAPRLWFAVLAQAFRDYYGDIPSEGPSRYRDVQVNYCRRNARAWFLSDSMAMGSFRWIAELFDLDPRAVRRRLFSGARIVLGDAPEEAPRAASARDDAASESLALAMLAQSSLLDVMAAA
jgi:hypothetical protein